MDSYFVIVTYPSGKDSMLRSGILRECDDGEIGCCFILCINDGMDEGGVLR